MMVCSRCGTQNPPGTAACSLCGSQLAPEPAAPGPAAGPKADFGRTVALPSSSATLIRAQPQPPEPQPAPQQPAPSPQPYPAPQRPTPAASPQPYGTPQPAGAPGRHFGATALGIPSFDALTGGAGAPEAARAPAPSPAHAHASAMGRTMLGVAPPTALPPLAAAPPAAAPPAARPEGGGFGRTMLGIAPVAAPPAGTDAQNPHGVAPPPAPGAAPPPGPGAHSKTILGVARPGIAPLNPGTTKAKQEAFPSPPPPPPLSAPPDPSREGAQKSLRAARQSSQMALIAVLGAGLLLATAALLFFMFRGPGKIVGRATLDAESREQLELGCAECKDGTVVRLGANRATFKNKTATLKLERELAVGNNQFTLALRAPDSARESTVTLGVPLEYRVRGDLGALGEPAPRLRVLVDAVPGSELRVAGQPLALNAAGKASFEQDVTRDLTGADPALRRLERRIPYSVKPPGGTTQNGEITIQLGIVPLTVEAPGESITVEGATFVLAGRTAKGGSASIEGRPIQITPDGRFAQVMSVSQPGETTVTLRASAPDHAPRLFPIRVRRVSSFADEAARVRAESPASYAAIAADPDQKRGFKVAIDGSVLEQSRADYSTLFLLDARGGCAKPPCLVRVVYGVRPELAPGDRVSVFGRVLGGVDGPRAGSKIPEVAADFVQKAKR